jgi:hypothetical protein
VTFSDSPADMVWVPRKGQSFDSSSRIIGHPGGSSSNQGWGVSQLTKMEVYFESFHSIIDIISPVAQDWAAFSGTLMVLPCINTTDQRLWSSRRIIKSSNRLCSLEDCFLRPLQSLELQPRQEDQVQTHP